MRPRATRRACPAEAAAEVFGGGAEIIANPDGRLLPLVKRVSLRQCAAGFGVYRTLQCQRATAGHVSTLRPPLSMLLRQSELQWVGPRGGRFVVAHARRVGQTRAGQRHPDVRSVAPQTIDLERFCSVLFPSLFLKSQLAGRLAAT